MPIMEAPKVNALLIPCAFELLFFVKKLTVIGSIGNTHGVATATNPPNMANKINMVMVSLGVWLLVLDVTEVDLLLLSVELFICMVVSSAVLVEVLEVVSAVVTTASVWFDALAVTFDTFTSKATSKGGIQMPLTTLHS